ncbi:hypothetical protein WICPIJ_006955 [Wickerhamomyces pijperi]|uniref:Uncharacterized protein n=1 Tax=Wickerhamomyces pijperi TaxID=599730 RepID=A0A9P8TKX4_WICPI|nr:hypothetical protein WICPIJ_006955 [Wickerhamomyces pijperi]
MDSKDLTAVAVFKSHNFTVWSAEVEARMLRWDLLWAKESTASVWCVVMCCCWFLPLDFLDFFLVSLVCEVGSPRITSGKALSTTSRFQISICGSNVPTATKFPMLLLLFDSLSPPGA